jgi:outer membrane lipoprotein-sorting protein
MIFGLEKIMSKFSLLFFTALSFLFANELTTKSTDAITPDLKKIGESIANESFVRATFIQNKEIAALNKTLVSTGEIVFSREAGIIWKMISPVAQTIAMPLDGTIKIFDENGVAESSGSSDIFGGGFSKTMHGLFSGEFENLLSVFELNFESQDDNWTLTLLPQRRQIARIMKEITLSGENSGKVTNFTITSTSGSDTKIEFNTHKSTPTLTKTERSQLGLKE